MNTPEFVKRDSMISHEQYILWLSEVKKRVRQAQAKAVLQVNTTMLELYWSIGRDLVALHPEEKWGKGIVRQFALDMRNAFPNETGFSDTNIKYMKRWYAFYNQSDIISQQAADQFSHQLGDQLQMPAIFGQVPWKLTSERGQRIDTHRTSSIEKFNTKRGQARTRVIRGNDGKCRK